MLIPTALIQEGGGSFEMISDVTLGVAAASLSFTSIPSSYKHLAVMLSIRSAKVANDDVPSVHFNNDTGANYYAERLVGISTTVAAGANSATATPDFGSMVAASGTAGDFTPALLLLPDYASTTKNKSGLWLSWSTSTLFVTFAGVTWRSTSAIDQIDVFASGGNIVADSRGTLYGMS